MNETVWNIEKLREIAIEQYGYVTSAQATGAGVTKSALSMLVKRQRLERVAFGVYRVPQIPVTQHDPLMLAILWTGVPNAVLSHDTALDAYDVSDINPTAIHVTVPKKRRIQRSGDRGYALHHEDLHPNQIGWWEGIPIVTLVTAIEQGIEGGMPTYLLKQVVERGRRRGLLTVDQEGNLLEDLESRNG